MNFMSNKERRSNIERLAGLRRRLLHSLFDVLAAGIVGIYLCALSASAQQTNSVSPNSYESFRIIGQRNIFDPSRSPRITRPGWKQNTRPTRTVDAFSLVGTMSYEKGKFAFFDGPSSQYQKVVEPGATIAGYTVKDVSPKSVTLAANGKEFEMKVGTQLRNEGENGWRLSDSGDMTASASSDSNSEPAAAQAPPTGASPEMSERLKMLMQRREQELK